MLTPKPCPVLSRGLWSDPSDTQPASYSWSRSPAVGPQGAWHTKGEKTRRGWVHTHTSSAVKHSWCHRLEGATYKVGWEVEFEELMSGLQQTGDQTRHQHFFSKFVDICCSSLTAGHLNRPLVCVCYNADSLSYRLIQDRMLKYKQEETSNEFNSLETKATEWEAASLKQWSFQIMDWFHDGPVRGRHIFHILSTLEDKVFLHSL